MFIVIPIILLLAIGFVAYWIRKINSEKQGEIQINQAREVSEMLKSAQKPRFFGSNPRQNDRSPGIPEEIRLSKIAQNPAAQNDPAKALPAETPKAEGDGAAANAPEADNHAEEIKTVISETLVTPPVEAEEANNSAEQNEIVPPETSVVTPVEAEEADTTATENTTLEAAANEPLLTEETSAAETPEPDAAESEEEPAKPKRKSTRKPKADTPEAEDPKEDQ